MACQQRFKVTDEKNKVFIVQSLQMKITQSPDTTSSCSLLTNEFFPTNYMSHLQAGKQSVIIHNAMALWNLLVIKQYRFLTPAVP